MSDTTTRRILVLGSRWSGKSLLIKRLENLLASSKASDDEFLHTTATIGKTLTVIKTKRSIEFHEIGGSLNSLWKRFYSSTNFDKILYVIDSTQPWSVSVALSHLQEISDQISISPKDILLIFNKMNEINSLTKMALTELIDFSSLWNGELDILETNARNGTNLSLLHDWLLK